MNRRRFLSCTTSALALVLSSGLAAGHSLESLQKSLFEKEKYFQIKDEPAPDFSLEDSKGKVIRLDDLRGKVVVLHFIYASCPDVCPLHAEKIAQVQTMVNITPMKDRVEFLTITTDPVRDTPEIMDRYGASHGLDPVNWRFLTSGTQKPDDTTRKLAMKFGHRFIKTDDGFQTHSVVTHVIDQNGKWVANFHGLEFGSSNLVLFVNALTNSNIPHHEPDPSVWQRISSFF